MVLTDEQLAEEMTDEMIKYEIEMIQKAPNCQVIYKTFVSDKKRADICETMFKKAGCDYHESTLISRGITKWVKGNIRLSFEVA
ncbi:MAG: hypothetical protein IKF83_04940 [Clostridia bacterium]|nr:hypothetical protein [Clostridia bacterium]